MGKHIFKGVSRIANPAELKGFFTPISYPMRLIQDIAV
jgi:hypothetical protein